MFSIKSVYITVPHNSHSTILCVLASMVYVALRQITVQYQMQLSDENTSIHSIMVIQQRFLVLAMKQAYYFLNIFKCKHFI